MPLNIYWLLCWTISLDWERAVSHPAREVETVVCFHLTHSLPQSIISYPTPDKYDFIRIASFHHLPLPSHSSPSTSNGAMSNASFFDQPQHGSTPYRSNTLTIPTQSSRTTVRSGNERPTHFLSNRTTPPQGSITSTPSASAPKSNNSFTNTSSCSATAISSSDCVPDCKL